MNKYVIPILIFIVLSSFVLAREDLAGKSYVIVDSRITSTIETQTTTDAEVDHIIADLYFFPQENWHTEIQELKPLNGGRVNGKNIEWVWLKPEKNLNFGVNSVIKSYIAENQIKTKTQFPLPFLDAALQQYLVDTPHIDASNPEIIALASSLAEGEIDQFTVVSKLAYWTRSNIKYNLTTLTADVSQKASWVLAHKTGVCDELTNVFIAFNRALGIPARFISGISYTNSEQFLDPWSPHGWAEVYFPDYGWIPFDPTYGQYGWVDATHIKMRESLDPNEPSTTYEWRGRGITLRPQELSFATQVSEIGEELPPLVDIKTDIIKENVGFNSYDLITADITNNQNVYLAIELSATQTSEMIFVDNPKQLMVLAPGEHKKTAWRFFIAPNLSPDYKYHVPLMIYTSRNENTTTSFEIAAPYATYTKTEIEKNYDQLQIEEEKVYSKDVDLRCRAWESKFYQNQNNNITCIIQNKGNVYLESLQVCLEERCREDINLGIGQAKRIIFPITWEAEGNKELEVHISNNQISKSFSVPLERADFPEFSIRNIKAPKEVKFGDIFTIEFTVRRTSQDPPKDVTIVFSRSGVDKVWEVSELHEQIYSITLYAEDFDNLDNTFEITAYFTTPSGQYIEKKESVTVSLDPTTVSFNRRVHMFFNKLVNWVESWF